MPYNYLIDPKIRDNYKIDFENSIIILDEAHNIEKVSEEVASFDLNLGIFTPILNELGHLANLIESGPQEDNASPF
jgi:Rad3-related DNA helicase